MCCGIAIEMSICDNQGVTMQLRNPFVRETLIAAVVHLGTAGDLADDAAVGDAMDEVDHLLNPKVGGEPGDVLRSEQEILLGRDLWRALERAPWPLDVSGRAADPAWSALTPAAAPFLSEAASNDARLSRTAYSAEKFYRGFAWIGESPLMRITTWATGPCDATAAIKARLGDVYRTSLWNDDDASRPR